MGTQGPITPTTGCGRHRNRTKLHPCRWLPGAVCASPSGDTQPGLCFGPTGTLSCGSITLPYQETFSITSFWVVESPHPSPDGRRRCGSATTQRRRAKRKHPAPNAEPEPLWEVHCYPPVWDQGSRMLWWLRLEPPPPRWVTSEHELSFPIWSPCTASGKIYIVLKHSTVLSTEMIELQMLTRCRTLFYY